MQCREHWLKMSSLPSTSTLYETNYIICTTLCVVCQCSQLIPVCNFSHSVKYLSKQSIALFFRIMPQSESKSWTTMTIPHDSVDLHISSQFWKVTSIFFLFPHTIFYHLTHSHTMTPFDAPGK